MTEDETQLLEIFIDDTSQSLERLEEQLLQLRRAPSAELVDELFRIAHTIKGDSGVTGMTAMARLAHRMESQLDRYRQGEVPTSGAISTMLDVVDALRNLLRGGEDLYSDLHARLDAGAPSSPPPSRIRVKLTPSPELCRSGIDMRLVLAQFPGTELVVSVDASELPGLGALDPTALHLRWTLEASDVSCEFAEAIFSWLSDVCVIETEIIAATPHEPGKSPAPKVAPPAPDANVRVRVERLDALMSLVGDLTITQTALQGIEREVTGTSEGLRARALLDQLAHITRALQENVLQLRSTPIGRVFRRFPRLVHDLAQSLGKQIELELVGEATELDKTVIERIGDPLVHMLRNSIDHGIETPAVREAAGKPATGHIRLSAEHRGGEIFVELSDDGRGLDTAKILARARARGLVAESHTPSQQEIFHLIVMPGFSTADTVSEVSGRGVGMDVVTRTIRDLGGNLRIDSVLGHGTTISLRLPLTLAIVEGQLVRVGMRNWVLPLQHIVECVQFEPAALTLLYGQSPLYRLREELLPIIDLSERFGLASTRPGQVLVIVEANGQRRALRIDGLGPRQQVVIKSLVAQLDNVEDISGATVLGDGSIALILDTARLCNATAPS